MVACHVEPVEPRSLSIKNGTFTPTLAQNTLRWSFLTSTRATSCQVYNASGQLLENVPITSSRTSIDVSAFPNGVYWLKVRDRTENVGPLTNQATSLVRFVGRTWPQLQASPKAARNCNKSPAVTMPSPFKSAWQDSSTTLTLATAVVNQRLRVVIDGFRNGASSAALNLTTSIVHRCSTVKIARPFVCASFIFNDNAWAFLPRRHAPCVRCQACIGVRHPIASTDGLVDFRAKHGGINQVRIHTRGRSTHINPCTAAQSPRPIFRAVWVGVDFVR